MFEPPITFSHGDGSTSAGLIDCYRQRNFVPSCKTLSSFSADAPRVNNAPVIKAARSLAYFTVADFN